MNVQHRSNRPGGWRTAMFLFALCVTLLIPTACDPVAPTAEPQPVPLEGLDSTAGSLVEAPASGRLGHPDIILILLDAARADVFEDSALAPQVVELAAQGTCFRSAWSPSSWTGQSVPAIITGRHPDALGITSWNSAIPPAVPKLPEILQAAGYHSVVWSQHPMYRNNERLHYGFEDVSINEAGPNETFDKLPGAVDLFVDDQPTFALVHLIPPHYPYVPPEPFRGSLSSWYQGKLKGRARGLHGLLKLFAETEDQDTEEAKEVHRYGKACYDENARFADDLVGRLLASFKEAGRYEEALIVVFADHGEAFFEHGLFGHTTTLYEEFIHVPLVIKWPAAVGKSQGIVETPVSVIDLAPTITDGIGIEDQRFQGHSLLPLAFDESGALPPSPGRAVVAHTCGTATNKEPPSPKWAIRRENLKLVYAPPQMAFYDLATDPEEQVNLAASEPPEISDELAHLRTLLIREVHQVMHRNSVLLAGSGTVEETDPLDPETARNLKALGYIH